MIDLILSHEVTPMINQIELHPFCQQEELRSIMQKYDIKPMAWAPFAEGNNGIFINKVLSDIGKNHDKTPAQVILRWLYQSDIIAIPKSVHLERIEQNFDIWNFLLTDKELEMIAAMDLKKSSILNIQSVDEVYRLHNITFKQ